MQPMVCRDCGLTLPIGARGCPRCALNLEAENKFDRMVWTIIAPSVLVLTILLILLVLYLIR
jgi:hypothetical protein